jgi:hypothetical protein
MSPQECGPRSGAAEHSRLIDILVHVPRLLEQQRKIQDADSHNTRHTLIYHVEKYLATTRKWRLRWLKANHTECDASYPLLGLTQCGTFSKVLSCSMRQATDVCLHNAVVLMLVSILWSLQSGPVSSQGGQLACLVPDQISTLERVALGISTTMEHQMMTLSQDPSSKLEKLRSGCPESGEDNGSIVGSTQLPSILRGLWLRLWPARAFPLM